MFVAVDGINGQAYGPFNSRRAAIKWAYGLSLHLGEIPAEDEEAAQAQPDGNHPEAIAQDLMSMSWTITEVQFVEEHIDEDFSDFSVEADDWLVIKDDGEYLSHTPFHTHEQAARAALEDLTSEETLPVYSHKALDLLEDFRLDSGQPGLRERALALIHEVDWILVRKVVYESMNNIDWDDES